MDRCYLCGKQFNDNNVKKHDEHVIQQAIGGNLTVNNILCSSCGSKLGKDIDVPFVNIFDGIATRLDIKKDRKGDKQKTKTVNGKMGDIDVVWKDFKVSPTKPFHTYTIDKKSVIIYANQLISEKYKSKVVEKEIKENLPNAKLEIIICDDMEGIITYPFNMNNQAFKKGLAKIAIGFASHCSIERENIPLVLKINKNTNNATIQDKIIAIPFYPLGVIDKLIEVQKNEFEHYPFHNIILFTINYYPSISKEKKVLVCYIELFSTFQWYIVLNDEYYGDSIYEYYSQQILKKDDYNVELGRRYYKERNIWLQPLGITEEYIDKKYKNQQLKILSKLKWFKESNISLITQQANIFLNLKNRSEIEYEIIQEETIKQKYKFDFESHMNHIISRISNQIIIFQKKEKFLYINNDMTNFLKNEYIVNNYKIFNSSRANKEFFQNLKLFYSLDDKENEIFQINSFRVFFYKNGKLKNYYSELLEKYQFLKNKGLLKDYHHKKMYILENYIFQENIKQKMKK